MSNRECRTPHPIPRRCSVVRLLACVCLAVSMMGAVGCTQRDCRELNNAGEAVIEVCGGIIVFGLYMVLGYLQEMSKGRYPA